MKVSGYFFYDANILFDLPSGRVAEALWRESPKNSRYQNAKRIYEAARKLGIACVASSITYDLLDKRIREVTDFAGIIIKSLTIRIKQEKKNTATEGFAKFDPKTDLFIVERFVRDEFRKIAQSMVWERESLLLLERAIVETVEDSLGRSGHPVETQEVLSGVFEMLKQFNEISNARKTELAKLKSEISRVDATLDPPTLFMLKHKVGMMDEEDLSQLAIAIQQQKLQNKWTVVVSTDYLHIIGAREALQDSVRLTCCGPLYAVSHLNALNLEHGPTPYPDKIKYIG